MVWLGGRTTSEIVLFTWTSTNWSFVGEQMQDSGCPPLKVWKKKTSQSTKNNGVHKPKISWVCWSLWEQLPQGLPNPWRYLLPCAMMVGYLSQMCRDWDGTRGSLSPWAALACSCLFFDPLLEFFQDRLILFFHLRALLLICNHFPMSYQPRKLLFLATVAWRWSGTVSQCSAFVPAAWTALPFPKWSMPFGYAQTVSAPQPFRHDQISLMSFSETCPDWIFVNPPENQYFLQREIPVR